MGHVWLALFIREVRIHAYVHTWVSVNDGVNRFGAGTKPRKSPPHFDESPCLVLCPDHIILTGIHTHVSGA